VIDPKHLPVNTRPPPVQIEQILVNGSAYHGNSTTRESVRLPPNVRTLEIQFTALSLTVPEKVRFRFRLEGQDPDWREVVNQRRVEYSNLTPGAHRFRLTAANNNGVWNDLGTSVDFIVPPALYQTLWFRVLVVLLIGAIGAAAATAIQRRRHVREQEALNGQYRATLAERARIAQELHDTLLQGFVGVTLQIKAAETALRKQPDVAAETLLRVQQLARASLREARARVWEMRDTDLGDGDLPDALEAIAKGRTAGMEIEVSVSCSGRRRRLERAVEDAAFLIGREAIMNAVRHAEPHRIDVRVEFDEAALRLAVRDDGLGFTVDEGVDAHRTGHFGLSGIRERAQRLGGRCDISSLPGHGTTVSVELPITGRGSR